MSCFPANFLNMHGIDREVYSWIALSDSLKWKFCFYRLWASSWYLVGWWGVACFIILFEYLVTVDGIPMSKAWLVVALGKRFKQERFEQPPPLVVYNIAWTWTWYDVICVSTVVGICLGQETCICVTDWCVLIVSIVVTCVQNDSNPSLYRRLTCILSPANYWSIKTNTTHLLSLYFC